MPGSLRDVRSISSVKTPVSRDGICLVYYFAPPSRTELGTLKILVKHMNNSSSLHFFGPHHPL